MAVDRDLNKLKPEMKAACLAFLAETKKQGLHVFVTEALRTAARQRELYAQGRTKPGKIVTWTLHSRHLIGDAFDIAFEPKIHGSLYPDNFRLWNQVGEIGENLGLERGGRWKFQDKPHFQGSPRLGKTGSKSIKDRNAHPVTSLTHEEEESKRHKIAEDFIDYIQTEDIDWDKDFVQDLPEKAMKYLAKLDLPGLAKEYIEKLDLDDIVKDVVYLAVNMVEKKLDGK